MGSPEEKATNTQRLKQQKAAARRAARARLARWRPARWTAVSRPIAARIRALPVFTGARVVAAYLAMPSEVQTAALISACRRAGKRLCVPAFDARAGVYRFAWLTARDRLVPGRWAIPEPARPRWVTAPEQTVQLALVPGLRFDRAGRRLGHGAGYFDRLLQGLSACKIGLASEAQLARRVPAGTHDVRMDWVVTEKNLYAAAGRRLGAGRERAAC